MSKENTGGGFWTGVIVAAVIFFIFFRTPSKYEGLTAEEWFNEYDATTACLEDIKSTADNYYSTENYSYMKSGFDEIFSKANNCI